MFTTRHSPLSLHAADLMSSDVVLLPAEMSLQAAARLLFRMQISGAPVVDDTGHCIGVLSTTDFMHCIEHDGEYLAECRSCSQVHSAWEMPADEETGEKTERTCLVRDYMTTNLVTAPLSASLPELARIMLEAHIHHLVVVDKEMRPLGIVTSTDILSVLARAAGVGLEHAASS